MYYSVSRNALCFLGSRFASLPVYPTAVPLLLAALVLSFPRLPRWNYTYNILPFYTLCTINI